MSRLPPLALFAALLAAACAPPDDEGTAPGTGGKRPAGWTEKSHGKKTRPQYDLVFPQGKVHRIDVTIAAADWQALRTDMTAQLGAFGSGGLVGTQPGTVSFFARDPIYAPATVTFEGKTWQHVGFRYRGNATLAYAWRQGKNKLPFKLDFDELEKQFPAVQDQRFHGVRAIAFTSNWGDPSFLREKVAGDLYRAAGVPCGRAAYYRVFIDHGQGPVYFGLYTAVEMPTKPMLAAHFGDDGGNLYKGDGDGAKFGRFDARAFEKKTNEETDFRDVEAVFAALHESRLDAAAWRAKLEKVFDTGAFLRWLAANTVMTNWDTYGQLAHNFYLYGIPSEGGRLRWFPWDHNESFKTGSFLHIFRAPSPSLKEIDGQWPLIRFLLDDPTYRRTYHAEMKKFVEGPFALPAVTARLRAEHALVAPYVVGTDGEKASHTLLPSPGEFTKELDEILRHVQARHTAAAAALKAAP